MKIITVVGTRPELIRLSLIIPKLDQYCDHILVHTGQNYDDRLNKIFFNDLGIRKPDYELGVRGDMFGEQIGKILIEGEKVLRKEKPDRVLILGDTNSSLVSIIAKRMGIPVYHMESGNRCFDDRVPEEVNRRLIDHCSTILLPYTHRSKENLLREGISIERIYVTGNPIYEVLETFSDKIQASTTLGDLELQAEKYFLATYHREENVDIEERLRSIVLALEKLQEKYDYPIICSVHPRTRKRMQTIKIKSSNDKIRFLQPLSFFDFVALEKSAFCVLTDSGTVQEECCIFKVPNVTIRDVTERPETIECGSNILSGVYNYKIVDCVNSAVSEPNVWEAPPEYVQRNVSSVVLKIILGYRV
ncbi:MAG: UDP-N-acetylglucosamine 2-epimerase (non-hydrolyzing) [Bacteroidetes bacterium]|nr:UDP-N-acetylglucosamine 2-epimerase (non-hydrolyzing) [Bacteroidota bacterium]